MPFSRSLEVAKNQCLTFNWRSMKMNQLSKALAKLLPWSSFSSKTPKATRAFVQTSWNFFFYIYTRYSWKDLFDMPLCYPHLIFALALRLLSRYMILRARGCEKVAIMPKHREIGLLVLFALYSFWFTTVESVPRYSLSVHTSIFRLFNFISSLLSNKQSSWAEKATEAE